MEYKTKPVELPLSTDKLYVLDDTDDYKKVTGVSADFIIKYKLNVPFKITEVGSWGNGFIDDTLVIDTNKEEQVCFLELVSDETCDTKEQLLAVVVNDAELEDAITQAYIIAQKLNYKDVMEQFEPFLAGNPRILHGVQKHRLHSELEAIVGMYIKDETDASDCVEDLVEYFIKQESK